MLRNSLLAIGLVAGLAAPALADTYTVDKAHSEAAFQVRHILTKVRGTFRDFSGTINFDKAKPEASSVEFRIKATSIDTGIQKRDDHLRSPDFFDVATHPEIVFKSTKVVAKGGNKFDVTGDFTLHGVTKSITLPVTFLGEQKFGKGVKAGFETSLTINRKDYGLNWNAALETGGFLVGDEVTISVSLQAVAG
jgi:polyisoprenoid-binding protein YceI